MARRPIRSDIVGKITFMSFRPNITTNGFGSKQGLKIKEKILKKKKILLSFKL